MRLSKILLTLIILIGISSPIFAYTINTLAFSDNYINSTKRVYFNGTATGDGPLELNIYSQKDVTGIDFNVDVASGNFSGSFNVSLTATQSSLNGTVPTIVSNTADTITIKDKLFPSTWSMKMDSISPVSSPNVTVSALSQNHQYFYSKDINVSYGAITDADNYIDKYITYLVTVSNLSNYRTNYTKRYIDSNTTFSRTINSISENISDGNYYVLVDANDVAGNFCNLSEVTQKKQLVYFDNSKPGNLNVNLGTLTNNRIYVKTRTFNLNVTLTDASGIKSESTLVLTLPNSTPIIKNYISGFAITSGELGSWEDGNIFRISIDANDNLNNNYTYDFNIIVDATAPTKPNRNTLAIEDVDKNVTITWQAGASLDSASGLAEYRVYKSASNFTTITNQELVCTVGTTTYTCKDSDDKELDNRIYYGLVGIDYAENISDANTQSVWTGPDCDLTINDDDDDYTSLANVLLEIDYSDDVNEMAISCNTSFPAYLEADNDYNFNITTGRGCNTKNEKKTVYVKVKSKNDTTRTSICSSDIYFDSLAPTTPTNLVATTMADGSVRLTWTASEDINTDSDITYRIYYSYTNNVTTSSTYKASSTNNHTYRSNRSTTLYFRVSALDERNNESGLSSTVSGILRKIGPSFTITFVPLVNDVNGTHYVGAGSRTINFESDESLLGNPVVSLKQSTNNFVNLTSTYDNSTKKGQAIFEFIKSGDGIIKIIGTNTKNEQSTTEYLFTIDVVGPTDFNYGYVIQNPTTYNLWVSNLPTDIFKVEYILNNTTEICKKQQVTDYNCIYDANTTPDGNHTMNIRVYDKALNFKEKTFSFVLDNIDEDKVACDDLRKEISKRLNLILVNLDLYRAVDIYKTMDKTINDKIALVNSKRTTADERYAQGSYASAKDAYQLAKNEIILIEDMLPPITIVKTGTTRFVFDGNTSVRTDVFLDKNFSDKTKELYSQNIITADRNFEVLKIGNQNFFSVTLSINSNSDKEKTITIIEEIPKPFANNISKITFDKKIEVLLKNPVVKYTTTIPANSSETITYRSLTPITLVDMVTKYNAVSFSAPIIIDGNISNIYLNIKKPVNTTLLIYIFSIIILVIIIIVIISAITSYQKQSTAVKPDSKKIMYDYLGVMENNAAVQEKQKAEEQKTKTEAEKKKDNGDKFNEDYQYILSAIKKR